MAYEQNNPFAFGRQLNQMQAGAQAARDVAEFEATQKYQQDLFKQAKAQQDLMQETEDPQAYAEELDRQTYAYMMSTGNAEMMNRAAAYYPHLHNAATSGQPVYAGGSSPVTGQNPSNAFVSTNHAVDPQQVSPSYRYAAGVPTNPQTGKPINPGNPVSPQNSSSLNWDGPKQYDTRHFTPDASGKTLYKAGNEGVAEENLIDREALSKLSASATGVNASTNLQAAGRMYETSRLLPNLFRHEGFTPEQVNNWPPVVRRNETRKVLAKYYDALDPAEKTAFGDFDARLQSTYKYYGMDEASDKSADWSDLAENMATSVGKGIAQLPRTVIGLAESTVGDGDYNTGAGNMDSAVKSIQDWLDEKQDPRLKAAKESLNYLLEEGQVGEALNLLRSDGDLAFSILGEEVGEELAWIGAGSAIGGAIGGLGGAALGGLGAAPGAAVGTGVGTAAGAAIAAGRIANKASKALEAMSKVAQAAKATRVGRLATNPVNKLAMSQAAQAVGNQASQLHDQGVDLSNGEIRAALYGQGLLEGLLQRYMPNTVEKALQSTAGEWVSDAVRGKLTKGVSQAMADDADAVVRESAARAGLDLAPEELAKAADELTQQLKSRFYSVNAETGEATRTAAGLVKDRATATAKTLLPEMAQEAVSGTVSDVVQSAANQDGTVDFSKVDVGSSVDQGLFEGALGGAFRAGLGAKSALTRGGQDDQLVTALAANKKDQDLFAEIQSMPEDSPVRKAFYEGDGTLSQRFDRVRDALRTEAEAEAELKASQGVEPAQPAAEAVNPFDALQGRSNDEITAKAAYINAGYPDLYVRKDPLKDIRPLLDDNGAAYEDLESRIDTRMRQTFNDADKKLKSALASAAEVNNTEEVARLENEIALNSIQALQYLGTGDLRAKLDIVTPVLTRDGVAGLKEPNISLLTQINNVRQAFNEFDQGTTGGYTAAQDGLSRYNAKERSDVVSRLAAIAGTDEGLTQADLVASIDRAREAVNARRAKYDSEAEQRNLAELDALSVVVKGDLPEALPNVASRMSTLKVPPVQRSEVFSTDALYNTADDGVFGTDGILQHKYTNNSNSVVHALPPATLQQLKGYQENFRVNPIAALDDMVAVVEGQRNIELRDSSGSDSRISAYNRIISDLGRAKDRLRRGKAFSAQDVSSEASQLDFPDPKSAGVNAVYLESMMNDVGTLSKAFDFNDTQDKKAFTRNMVAVVRNLKTRVNTPTKSSRNTFARTNTSNPEQYTKKVAEANKFLDDLLVYLGTENGPVSGSGAPPTLTNSATYDLLSEEADLYRAPSSERAAISQDHANRRNNVAVAEVRAQDAAREAARDKFKKQQAVNESNAITSPTTETGPRTGVDDVTGSEDPLVNEPDKADKKARLSPIIKTLNKWVEKDMKAYFATGKRTTLLMGDAVSSDMLKLLVAQRGSTVQEKVDTLTMGLQEVQQDNPDAITTGEVGTLTTLAKGLGYSLEVTKPGDKVDARVTRMVTAHYNNQQLRNTFQEPGGLVKGLLEVKGFYGRDSDIAHFIDSVVPHLGDVKIKYGVLPDDINATYEAYKLDGGGVIDPVITVAESSTDDVQHIMHEIVHHIAATVNLQKRYNELEGVENHSLTTTFKHAKWAVDKANEVLGLSDGNQWSFEELVAQFETYNLQKVGAYSELLAKLSQQGIRVPLFEARLKNAIAAFSTGTRGLYDLKNGLGATSSVIVRGLKDHVVTKPTGRYSDRTAARNLLARGKKIVETSRKQVSMVHFGFDERNPTVGASPTAWDTGRGWTLRYIGKDGGIVVQDGLTATQVLATARNLGLWVTKKQREFKPSRAEVTTLNRFGDFSPAMSKVYNKLNTLLGGTPEEPVKAVAKLAYHVQKLAIKHMGLDQFYKMVENAAHNNGLVDKASPQYKTLETKLNKIRSDINATLNNPGLGTDKTIFDLQQQLMEEMRKAGWTKERMNNVLYAKRAEIYRQKVLKNTGGIDKKTGNAFKRNENLSGFTWVDSNGELVTDDFDGSKYLATLTPAERRIADDIEQMMVALNNQVLALEFNNGRISEEQYNSAVDQFYVPLRGEADGATAFNKIATGRRTKADDVLTHFYANLEARVRATERSMMVQELHDFLQDNPVAGFASFNSTNAVLGADGDYTMRADGWAEGTSLTYYRDGKKHTVTFEHPALKQALKDRKASLESSWDPVLNMLSNITGILGMVRTMTPSFAKTQFLRDLGMVFFNNQAAFRGKSGLTSSQHLQLATKSFASMAKNGAFLLNESRKPAREQDWRVKVFRANGGIAKMTQFDLDTKRRELDTDVFGSGAVNRFRQGAKSVVGKYMDAIHTSDMAARYTVWMNYLEMKHGRPFTSEAELTQYLNSNPGIADVARDASKNITGNFEQRGTSRTARSLFMFWNAIMTGMRTTYGMLNPAYGMQGIGSVGVLAAYVMAQAFAEDEEDEDGIRSATRAKDLGNYISFGDVKVPLAQELRGVVHTAQALAYTMTGDWDLGKALDHWVKGVNSSVGAFTPAETGDALYDIMYAVTPTLLQPAMSMVTETGFFGNSLRPDVYDAEGRLVENAPDALRAGENTSGVAKTVALELYNLTNGSVDVLPGSVDAILNQVTGGFGAMFKQVTDSMEKGANPLEAMVGTLTRGHAVEYNTYATKDEWDELFTAKMQAFRVPSDVDMLVPGKESLPAEYHALDALAKQLKAELATVTGDVAGSTHQDLMRKLKALQAEEYPSPSELLATKTELEQVRRARAQVYAKYLSKLKNGDY